MMSRATQSELLEQRIAENASSQQVDLATWIFERVRVQPGETVLELCCGTGGQTLALLDLVGEGGHVTALDISRSALDTLASKAGSKNERLTCVEANLENFAATLSQVEKQHATFDLIFCAYGLYYSSDARRTLEHACRLLNPGGRIAVVGPFGPNNKPLFDLVRASGVEIAAPVIASSETFMLQTVVDWGARNCESLAVHTLMNPVRWTTPERVLNYWQNTTFYEAKKRDSFETLLQKHFTRESAFVNEKWIMLVEMRHVRS
ncbi:MAG: class I SAM-dependent methyltransferase [Candidatus Sulfotelmatobacter sp.]|jgi:ubiquinone/menaquinone biosynthesis C-methylase UbiE